MPEDYKQTAAEPTKRFLIGKLRAQSLASKVMADHYTELHHASQTGTQKIAWCSSVGPAELLRGMGFLVYFPENHAAMLGAARQSEAVMRYAGQEGYAPEICSYLRSDVGAFQNRMTALSRINKDILSPPHPDVLVYNTNQCRDIKDWFSWYGRRLDVPCIGIQSPRGIDEVTAEYIDSVTKQLQNLIAPLEQISRTKLNMDKLHRTTALSKQCSDLWKRALQTGRTSPSPLSFHAALTLMGPVVTARGTQTAVDFLIALNDELDARISEGVPAIKNERRRIYWDGMPIWSRLAEMHRLFSSVGANITASTYCNSWIFESLDSEHPIPSMAKAYTELFIARSDDAKEQYLRTTAREFRIDGIIFHESKTCPNNSNSRYGMPERLRKSLKIPVMTLYGDHVDGSMTDIERITTQVEAFAEQLDEGTIS